MIASLIVAFFAYIGFAVGGGFGSLASPETNSFSAGRGSQPLYLSLRDTARGIVTAERKAASKNNWHDEGAALPPAPPSLSRLDPTARLHDPVRATPILSRRLQAYLARGPPAAA